MKLAASLEPLAGTVHALLPAASATALAQPVRIDLKQPISAVGLFGTAAIVVGHHDQALAVPQGALLRDDVSGVTQGRGGRRGRSRPLGRGAPGPLARRLGRAQRRGDRRGREGDHRRPGRAARGREGRCGSMSWIDWLRSRRAAVLVTALVLAGFGIHRAATLPSAVFPSVTFPIVKVIVDVGEEPAARMMPTVTRPLEEAILRVPGIERVISTTSRGSTEMSALFAWGEDMHVALQRVQAETERVRPSLPADTHIDVEWMNPAVFPIEGYALTSATRSQAELWDFAQYTFKPALIRIPGVSEVQIQGGRQREFQVQLDPSALLGFKLTAADVVEALKSADDVQSAGLHEANHELYLTLIDGRARGLEICAGCRSRLRAGWRCRSPGSARSTPADEVSYVRTTAQGKPAVLVNVIRQPSANTVAIADAVDQLVGAGTLLPKDVEWTPFYDQARFVRASVNGVRDALLIGVGLAALVLLLFLRSFRLMAIAVVAIPLTAAISGLLLAAVRADDQSDDPGRARRLARA